MASLHLQLYTKNNDKMIIQFSPEPVGHPFSYKVRNDEGQLRDYSGKFTSESKARKWYRRTGIWLEQLFDRKLLMVKRVCKKAEK